MHVDSVNVVGLLLFEKGFEKKTLWLVSKGGVKST